MKMDLDFYEAINKKLSNIQINKHKHKFQQEKYNSENLMKSRKIEYKPSNQKSICKSKIINPTLYGKNSNDSLKKDFLILNTFKSRSNSTKYLDKKHKIVKFSENLDSKKDILKLSNLEFKIKNSNKTTKKEFSDSNNNSPDIHFDLSLKKKKQDNKNNFALTSPRKKQNKTNSITKQDSIRKKNYYSEFSENSKSLVKNNFKKPRKKVKIRDKIIIGNSIIVNELLRKKEIQKQQFHY